MVPLDGEQGMNPTKHFFDNVLIMKNARIRLEWGFFFKKIYLYIYLNVCTIDQVWTVETWAVWEEGSDGPVLAGIEFEGLIRAQWSDDRVMHWLTLDGLLGLAHLQHSQLSSFKVRSWMTWRGLTQETIANWRLSKIHTPGSQGLHTRSGVPRSDKET